MKIEFFQPKHNIEIQNIIFFYKNFLHRVTEYLGLKIERKLLTILTHLVEEETKFQKGQCYEQCRKTV